MRNIRDAKSGKIDLRSLKAAIRDCKRDPVKVAELRASIANEEDPSCYFRGFLPRFDAFGYPM